jgi:hypothetical protein
MSVCARPFSDDAGCTQEARYNAAEVSVLWGGGVHADAAHARVSAAPRTEEMTVGAAVTRNAQRELPGS